VEYLDLEEWERQETLEALGEALRLSNVYQRFKYIYFVSKSKGRGRERKYHKEIELEPIDDILEWQAHDFMLRRLGIN